MFKMDKMNIEMKIGPFDIVASYNREKDAEKGNFNAKVVQNIGKNSEEDLLNDFLQNLEFLVKELNENPTFKRLKELYGSN